MKKNPTMLLIVAAALVDVDRRILLQKRPDGREMAGLWEFPGGKIEAGESPSNALARELAEELAIEVESSDLRPLCFASEPLGNHNLLLLLFACERWKGEPTPIDGQELAWFTLHQIYDLPMPPADIPLLPILEKLL
jgi:8-oxo-dGTP diphosphatase